MLTCAICGGLTPRGTSRRCLHCDGPLRRSRLRALLGPAGAILLAACYGPPGRYYQQVRGPTGATRVDADHDGALGPWQCLANDTACEQSLPTLPVPKDLDCDDRDPARYPGAPDPDGDGIDQNCDGVDGWADPAQRATEPAPTTEPQQRATEPAPVR